MSVFRWIGFEFRQIVAFVFAIIPVCWLLSLSLVFLSAHCRPHSRSTLNDSRSSAPFVFFSSVSLIILYSSFFKRSQPGRIARRALLSRLCPLIMFPALGRRTKSCLGATRSQPTVALWKEIGLLDKVIWLEWTAGSQQIVVNWYLMASGLSCFVQKLEWQPGRVPAPTDPSWFIPNPPERCCCCLFVLACPMAGSKPNWPPADWDKSWQHRFLPASVLRFQLL